MNFCTFWRVKLTKLTKIRSPKFAYKAVFALQESSKLISHKNWVIEKSWNFYTVIHQQIIFFWKKIENNICFSSSCTHSHSPKRKIGSLEFSWFFLKSPHCVFFTIFVFYLFVVDVVAVVASRHTNSFLTLYIYTSILGSLLWFFFCLSNKKSVIINVAKVMDLQ